MGYLAYDAVVMNIGDPKDTQWLYDFRDQIRAWAMEDESECDLPGTWVGTLVGPIPHPVNGGETWVLTPDGSKEGWGGSQFGDLLRDEFTRLCRANKVDFVEVRFGGDFGVDNGARITRGSHDKKEER